MSGWFKIVTDRNASSSFFDYGSNATTDKTLETTSTGTLLQCWDGTNGVTGTDLVVGQWYYLAYSWDGSNCRAYVNGVLDITNPAANNPITNIRVGNSGANEFLNGRSSCVKVWNVVLTLDQIANEGRHCRPLRTQNLNRWAPMAYNVLAADALDMSGAGANYTVTSTPIVEGDYPPVSW